jgi:hypothetical protein
VPKPAPPARFLASVPVPRPAEIRRLVPQGGTSPRATRDGVEADVVPLRRVVPLPPRPEPDPDPDAA